MPVHHGLGHQIVGTDQMSMTLLYFSPWVTRPEANCSSISFTSASASLDDFALASGMTKSLTPMEAPDRSSTETGVHQLVGEDHRRLQAHACG
jgi:hypothetical protein